MVFLDAITPNGSYHGTLRNSKDNVNASQSVDNAKSHLSNDGTTDTFLDESHAETFGDDDKPHFEREDDREYVSVPGDVYNMFFLSDVGGACFWYSLYIFALKMALYTFLALDATKTPLPDPEDLETTVIIAQFLMLPVAVAMQEDLTATYFLIANIKYCRSIRNKSPGAYKWKFYAATLCRAVDGFYSLLVNFAILIAAEDILNLFLNFAALQFLQQIDNIALDLCANGYLSDRLEDVAMLVRQAELPKRGDDNRLRVLDSVLFLGTLFFLILVWGLHVGGQY